MPILRRSHGALAPLLATAWLGGCLGEPPITMPAGFETARPGTLLADVQAVRPKAKLTRSGGDVLLTESNDPPRFRDARIWFHAASQGPAPGDDQLKVQSVVLTTLDEEGLAVAVREVGRADEEGLAGMRKMVGDRFEQMRRATETSFGKPARCAPKTPDCEWRFAAYLVRLYTVDARTATGERVPVAVRYVIRLPAAPDVPPPAPIAAPAPAPAPAPTPARASDAAAPAPPAGGAPPAAP